ncbi:MAG: archease [Nitrospirae bacterium]|nr:MAG: archease [Nitrospirota bacterium]
MENEFEILDISGDVGIRVSGKSLEEIFKRSALGLYSLITETGSVNPSESIDVKVYSESLEGLVVGWLNELIFQFDANGFIGKELDIETLNENRVEAVVRGEKFDPDRHERGLLLKAATYHNLTLEKKNGLWNLEVIFDI